jgi:hypothetical protein
LQSARVEKSSFIGRLEVLVTALSRVNRPPDCAWPANAGLRSVALNDPKFRAAVTVAVRKEKPRTGGPAVCITALTGRSKQVR